MARTHVTLTPADGDAYRAHVGLCRRLDAAVRRFDDTPGGRLFLRLCEAPPAEWDALLAEFDAARDGQQPATEDVAAD